jgi:hypothetical protein
MGILQEQISKASQGRLGLDNIAMHGIAVISNTDDDFIISEDGMKSYCEKWGPGSKHPIDEWEVPILWRFLYEDYQFKAWR